MDEAEFADFAASATPRLRNLALALTGSRADAEDLLQITFEQVFRAWGRAAPENPVAYARATMTHRHISERRRARWRREHLSADVPDRSEDAGDAGDGGDRTLLFNLLRRLPERQRQAVVLRYLEDLSVLETAALMRCSTGNVTRLSHDALRALRAGMTAMTNAIDEEA